MGCWEVTVGEKIFGRREKRACPGKREVFPVKEAFERKLFYRVAIVIFLILLYL